jgi:hypothetical protein
MIHIKKMKAESKMMQLSWEGYHGREVYLLPYATALALVSTILHRVPSITLKDYEQLKIEWQDTGDLTSDDLARKQTKVPTDPDPGSQGS